MKKSRLAAAALLSAGLLVIGSPAHALGVSDNTTDDAGDAAPTVDLVKVRTSRTATAYRAVLTFTDLKPTAGTRRQIRFSEVTFPSGRLNVGNTHTVELITNLSGKLSTRVWKSNPTDQAGTVKPCSGVTAVANYTTEKVTFTIPNACWRPKTQLVGVTANAVKVPAAAWSTASLTNDITTSDDTAGYLWQAAQQM